MTSIVLKKDDDCFLLIGRFRSNNRFVVDIFFLQIQNSFSFVHLVKKHKMGPFRGGEIFVFDDEEKKRNVFFLQVVAAAVAEAVEVEAVDEEVEVEAVVVVDDSIENLKDHQKASSVRKSTKRKKISVETSFSFRIGLVFSSM